MGQVTRYPFVRNTQLLCANLGIDPKRVMQRAGLSPVLLNDPGRGLNLHDYFDVWDAVMAETGTPEASVNLSLTLAHGLFSPRTFAFSRAPTVVSGLQRLSLFYPLLWPVVLNTEIFDGGLRVTFRSKDPNRPAPTTLSAFNLLYLLELVRRYSSVEVKPRRAALESYAGDSQRLENLLRCPLEDTADFLLEFSASDGEIPLVSETPEMWESFPSDLRPVPQQDAEGLPVRCSVRSALLELLPGGQSGIDTVGQRLGLSKRSLQRQLAADGQQFQDILNATRTELALHYLQERNVLVEEISILLGFKDTNAFYRAFRGWTGMTPAEARGHAVIVA